MGKFKPKVPEPETLPSVDEAEEEAEAASRKKEKAKKKRKGRRATLLADVDESAIANVVLGRPGSSSQQ